MRTVAAVFGALFWAVAATSGAVDFPGGKGGGRPKVVNLTGESLDLPAVSEGGKYQPVEGCSLAACAAAVKSPAFAEAAAKPLFILQEKRPKGTATFLVNAGGELRLAVIESGKTAKVLQRFDLLELRRIYLLEVARGTKDAQTGEWRFEAIPGATHPLRDEYLSQLRIPNRAGGQKVHEGVKWLEYRMDESIGTGVHSVPNPPLLVEAVKWMGVGSAPLLKEALTDPKIGEFETAPAVALICSVAGIAEEATRAPLQELVRHNVKPELGGFISAAALGCFEAAQELARPYVLKAVELMCLGPPSIFEVSPVLQAWALRLKIYEEVTRRANRCGNPERRELMKTCLNQEATQESLEQVLEDGGPEHDEALLRCLDPRQPMHRAAVAASLSRDEVARIRALEFLARSDEIPSSDELFGVAAAYAREAPAEGKGLYRWRADALDYFARAEGDAARTEAARQALQTVLKTEETPPGGFLDQLGAAARSVKRLGIESVAPEMRIGLAVLGERDLQLPAARAVFKTVPLDKAKVTGYHELVAYGLLLCGCDEKQVEAGAQKAKASTEPRGTICPEPKKPAAGK